MADDSNEQPSFPSQQDKTNPVLPAENRPTLPPRIDNAVNPPAYPPAMEPMVNSQMLVNAPLPMNKLPNEVLPPMEQLPTLPPVPRQDLIATAIKFLQNPKVRQSPFAHRRAFLERKGLTQAEIDLAIMQSGTAGDETLPPPAPAAQPTQNAPGHGMQPMPPAYPPGYSPVPPPVPSRWVRVRDTASLAIFLSGAAYAAYHFYQRFLAPVLFKKQLAKQADQLADVNRNVDELRRNMMSVVASISDTQTLLRNQQRQLEEVLQLRAGTGGAVRGLDDYGLSDVRNEIRSLKTILLNRSQFPPPPRTAPIIPAWQQQMVVQRSSTELQAAEESRSNGTTDAQQNSAVDDVLADGGAGDVGGVPSTDSEAVDGLSDALADTELKMVQKSVRFEVPAEDGELPNGKPENLESSDGDLLPVTNGVHSDDSCDVNAVAMETTSVGVN